MQVPQLRLDTLDDILTRDRTLEPIADDLRSLITEVRERRLAEETWKTRAESVLAILTAAETDCKVIKRELEDLTTERDFWKGCAAQAIDKWIDQEGELETVKQTAEHWKRAADNAVAGWEEEERLREMATHTLAAVQKDANEQLAKYRYDIEKMATTNDGLRAVNDDLAGQVAQLSATRADLEMRLAAVQKDANEQLEKYRETIADLKMERTRGIREGFDIAEEHAEVSETDGWHRVNPYIDWDYAREKLEAAISLALQGTKP